MSAIDKMVSALVNAMGLNMDEVKGEVTRRIANFEGNVQTLNSTLINQYEIQRRIEHNLKRHMALSGLLYEEAPPVPAPQMIEGTAANV